MSNLNKRRSSSPSYRKGKSWIEKIIAADILNDQFVQSHIVKLTDSINGTPTYRMYAKLLPTLRKKYPHAKYPSMPKCSKEHITLHWGVFTKKFTTAVTTCVKEKGNGNSRDSLGRFAPKEPIKISRISSDLTSPSLPKGFFKDMEKAFSENKMDSAIDLGQTDVIFDKDISNNQFTPSTTHFFHQFKEYAAKKLLAFNERSNLTINGIHDYNDVSVQIIRFRNNQRTHVGGLSAHHDPHYVGTLIWVIEEHGCKATFEYKEKDTGKWNSFSKEDGYTSDAELIMINNLFHRVLVEPDDDSSPWSRIILSVFL